MELATDQTDRFGSIKVDRIGQFGDYYSSIPVWDWRNCMRAAVSFFETVAFFCDQDGHTARGVSAHIKQSGSTYHRSSDLHNQGAH